MILFCSSCFDKELDVEVLDLGELRAHVGVLGTVGVLRDERDAHGRLFKTYPPGFLRLMFERLGFSLMDQWDNTDTMGRQGVQWVSMTLYPAGYVARGITVQPNLKHPTANVMLLAMWHVILLLSVAFLASPLSGYTTGTVLTINGGG